MKTSNIIIIGLLSLLSTKALATLERISSIYKDIGRVEKIYLHSGFISVLEFPDPILEVRLGNNKSLKAEISQVSPKELSLFLIKGTASATNLIVRSNQKLYVFDVIPSKETHQDYVKVLSGFGSPKLATAPKIKIGSETMLEKRLIESIKIGESK